MTSMNTAAPIACLSECVVSDMAKSSALLGTVVANASKTNSGGKLQAACPVTRRRRKRPPERWVGSGIPEIRNVAGAVSPLRERILHFVYHSLLKVRMIQDIERFRTESQPHSLLTLKFLAIRKSTS